MLGPQGGHTMPDRRFKPAEIRRDSTLKVRVTRAESAELDAAQLSVSEYVRRAALVDR